MTPSLLIRPVLLLVAAASVSGCGMIDSDPHRFENLAEKVAAIPLDGRTGPAATPVRTAEQNGLRPAMASGQPAALRVEVMDPYSLWDARDAGLRGAIEQAAPKMIEAAAPAVAHAVVQQVSERVTQQTARLRPALSVTPPRPPASGRALVQLGAFSSQASARAAWTRLKSGEAAWALDGLSPVFEAVRVNNRDLVRLKVPAPVAGAGAVCAAARIDDPWCRRAT